MKRFPKQSRSRSRKRQSPRVEKILEWDSRFVWHPFTQQAEWESDPDRTIWEEGRGVWLKDARGFWLLDGVASLWCNVWGHRVPDLDKAVERQLKRFAHATFLGATHEVGVRLAKELTHLAPAGLKRVFYSDSGSEANEIALKMAFQYQRQTTPPQLQRDRFLSFKEGYHGDTLGAVSVGGIDLFHGIFEKLLFPVVHAPAPAVFHGKSKSSTEWRKKAVCAVARLFERYGNRLAAVHMEPLVEGAGGMLLHPPGFLKAIRRLCDRFGVLLILDEVATGFGRTGWMFACQKEGVRPDFLCLGKNLTAGYLPLAATLTTEKIYRAFLGSFDSLKTFYHGHTFTANPLACAAALANIRRLRKRSFLPMVRRKARLLAERLKPLEEHPHVKEVRLCGMMGGIELIQNKKKNQPYPYGWKIGYRVCAAARKKGVWLRPLGNVLVVMPPLGASLRELDFLCRVLRESIHEVTLSVSRGI